MTAIAGILCTGAVSALTYLCTEEGPILEAGTTPSDPQEKPIDRCRALWSVVTGIGAGSTLYCLAESCTVSISLPVTLAGLVMTVASKYMQCCNMRDEGDELVPLKRERQKAFSRRGSLNTSYGSVIVQVKE